VQNALKYLLSFGAVGRYLGYSSLKDFFPSMDIKPSAGCVNPRCLEAQRAYQVKGGGLSFVPSRQLHLFGPFLTTT
jgi:ubiquitin-like modifier-activating enzyme 5